MAIYTYLKRLAKRKAGCWGRVNHKKDMRAASKAIRQQQKDVLNYPIWRDPTEIDDYVGLPSIIEEKDIIVDEAIQKAMVDMYKEAFESTWQQKLDELFEEQLTVSYGEDNETR